MGRKRQPQFELPKHVHLVRSRGKEYFYYHPFRGTDREGQRIKLPGAPFTPGGRPDANWWDAYYEASGHKPSEQKPGTFEALIAEYQQSPDWLSLASSTRTDYARYFKRILSHWGQLTVKGVQPKHVLALRDRNASTPAAANSMIRVLSVIMGWSVPRGYRIDNPCQHVRELKKGDGYDPWNWESIVHFRDNVSRPELWWAAALALYTGQRQRDVLGMQWSAYVNGLISVRQSKTGKKLLIPAHRTLKELFTQIPQRSTAILTNSQGRPWTQDGFRASLSKEMDRPVMADLRRMGLVFHGLRKSAVVFLLEAGCRDGEVAAVTGQSRQMIEHYARQVNQGKLAAAALLKWE